MSIEDSQTDAPFSERSIYFEIEIPKDNPPEQILALKSIANAFGWQLTRTNASIRSLFRDEPNSE